jgi:hypothetical protein
MGGQGMMEFPAITGFTQQPVTYGEARNPYS